MPLGPTVRAYALAAAVDMRRGFEGLWALATGQLGRDVLAGDLFLFVGRDRRRCKVLFFDGTGLCVLHKRLSKGRFAALWRCSQQPQLQLSLAELQLFLQGCQQIGRTQVAAIFYTLVETASRHGVDPRSYLLAAARHALQNPSSALLPWQLVAQ